MAIFSPLSSRRSAARKVEATQQLIVFRLRNEGFALPIRAVQKVIPMGNVYGAQQGTGVRLTLYQEQELLVIDVGHRIFREAGSEDALRRASEESELLPPSETAVERYLLIVQSSSRKIVGLPLSDPPALQRVPESAFTPLTADYISYGTIRCVSALVVLGSDAPPLFLLNPDQLVQPQQALPPAVR
jgi:purine-binding chemotaxis protein CheW